MKELNAIQVALNVPKQQFNNFGKYRYRSCEDILKALKPLLRQQNCTLTISDDIVPVGSHFYVKATATLTNEKGETAATTAFAREEESKKGMDASQVTGAASSYARKYALNGLFAIDDTKDADALNTSAEYTQPQPNPPLRQPQDARQESQQELLEAYARPAIQQAQTLEDLKRIYKDYPTLYGVQGFLSALSARRKQLGIGKR